MKLSKILLIALLGYITVSIHLQGHNADTAATGTANVVKQDGNIVVKPKEFTD